MLQTGGFRNRAVGSPMEDVQAVTGAVSPFRVHGDPRKPNRPRGDRRVSGLLLGSRIPTRQWSPEVIAHFPHSLVESMDKQDMTEFPDPRD